MGEGRGEEESGLSGSLEMIINLSKQGSIFVFNVISMARSVGGRDGSIPTLRLATRAGKMELSCRSGLPTLTVFHKKKFSQKPYKKILY